MRKSSEILSKTLVLGLVSAMALIGSESYAREPAKGRKPVVASARPQQSPTTDMRPWTTTHASNLETATSQAGSTVLAPANTKYSTVKLTRAANAIATETLEIAHEGFQEHKPRSAPATAQFYLRNTNALDVPPTESIAFVSGRFPAK